MHQTERLRLRVGLRSACLAGCLLIAFSMLMPGAASANPEPNAATPAMPSEPAPDEALARLQDGADAAGALGIFIDDQTGEIVVVGPSGSRKALEAANLAGDGLQIRILELDVSRSDVDVISQRLVALRSSEQLTGETYRFGFDPELGKVVLAATAPRSAFGDVLDAFPDLLVYREGEPAVRTSRSNDGEPHWGGAEITDGSGGCSSGYTVNKTSNGLNYMVTAGHCALLHAAITQPDTGLSYGTVASRATFPTRDMELIGGETYSGKIYVGDEIGVGRSVWTASNPALGASYCFSGTTTNESCGHVVTDTDETLCFVDGCTATWSFSAEGPRVVTQEVPSSSRMGRQASISEDTSLVV
jgi:hypothetical protein